MSPRPGLGDVLACFVTAHDWHTTRPPVAVILDSGVRPSLDERQRSWDDEVVEVCARCGAVRECRPAEVGGAVGSFLVFVVLLVALVVVGLLSVANGQVREVCDRTPAACELIDEPAVTP